MRKLIERLLIFFIGIPTVFALVFLFPAYHHLVLNIVIILFSALGSVEFSVMLEKKQLHISKIEAFILGLLAPLSAALTVSFNISGWIVPLILLTGALWVLISRVFSHSTDMEKIAGRIAGCFSIMVYPGIFMYWLIKMSMWEDSRIIFLFLLITFVNDSAAWLFGSLLGKGNRGIIPASPNKSIAGFFGGFLGAVAVSAGAAYFFPSIFTAEVNGQGVSNLFAKAIILGLTTGIFATLGDLCESVIKRSCGFDDSGKLILGRGGVLDSIDSLAIAAPVYFLLFNIFF